jgi:hypothetical protein
LPLRARIGARRLARPRAIDADRVADLIAPASPCTVMSFSCPAWRSRRRERLVRLLREATGSAIKLLEDERLHDQIKLRCEGAPASQCPDRSRSPSARFPNRMRSQRISRLWTEQFHSGEMADIFLRGKHARREQSIHSFQKKTYGVPE